MYSDIAFNRCFLCLPLRYGFIAYGYFKMILILVQFGYYGDKFMYWMTCDVTIVAYAACALLELVAYGALIVGGHLKRPRPLITFSFFGIAGILIEMAAAISMRLRPGIARQLFAPYMASIAADVVIQMYVVLLIRGNGNELEEPRDDDTSGYERVLSVKSAGARPECDRGLIVKSETA